MRDFQSVIGKEARAQMLEQDGKLPDVAVACVGGGSNAIGLFHPFLDDPVRLIGVEAGGDGVDTGKHAATLVAGRPGVLHGTRTYLLQDADGQILETHSISAGLDYPGVGPEHSWLKTTERAEYVAVDDKQALEGFQALTARRASSPRSNRRTRSYHAMQVAAEHGPDEDLLVGLSGRGDKDMHTVATALGVTL